MNIYHIKKSNAKNSMLNSQAFVMTDPNVTLRMLYLTIVIVALFVTCGLISALHEHGFQDIQYPFFAWNTKSNIYESNRRRRENKKTNNSAKHYRLPKDNVIENLSNSTLSKVYWFYINTIQTICRNVTSIASKSDGTKICSEELEKSKSGKQCLVYSIGYHFNYEFELNIKNTYKCEVHVVNGQRANKKSRRHGNGTGKILKGIHFYRLKISIKNSHKNTNEFYLLIRNTLLHAKRMIDIVKMDLNGDEWSLLPMLIDAGLLQKVKQLIVETHFGWGDVTKSEDLKILRKLYEENFRISSYTYRLTPDSIERTPNLTMCNINEITFINTGLKRKHQYS